MPTNTEIEEHQAKYGVRVWGVILSTTHDPSRWGDIAVVPFYDHVDAIKAAVDAERTRILTEMEALMPKDRHRSVRWLLDEFAVRRVINDEKGKT